MSVSSSGARLHPVAVAPRAEGLVLVLHGGASRRGAARVSPVQPSVLRMIPIASEIARRGAGRLTVVRVLNSRRGWDAGHPPLQDVRWAVEQARRDHGAELPVCLVGHSLGGRAALLGCGEPGVRGVVALAPWLYPTDAPARVGADTRVVIIHGRADAIADPATSLRVAAELRRRTRVGYVGVERGTHAMLTRRACFDGLAAGCAAWMLLGVIEGPVVTRLAAGEDEIEV